VPPVTKFERFGADEDPVLWSILNGNSYFVTDCHRLCDHEVSGRHAKGCETYLVRPVEETS
jgi:hypothetical protein